MTEIISGLWLDTNKYYMDREFMLKIDLPINCSYNNQIKLSLDLETIQLKNNLNNIIDYIYNNLNNLKNILLYNSDHSELKNAEIILIGFILKYTKINLKNALILVNNKVKKNILNTNSIEIVKDYNKKLNN